MTKMYVYKKGAFDGFHSQNRKQPNCRHIVRLCVARFLILRDLQSPIFYVIGSS